MKAVLKSGSIALALALAGCGGGNGDGGNATAAAAGPIEQIPAPNGGDWTSMVTQTAEGGFLMGNPEAPVKLVEFASLTCGHCAEFSENAMPELTERYIKSGQVSLELRNYVRDPADIAAALLSRCGGATPYYKLTEQMFAAQGEWLGKLQAMSPADQQRLSTLPPQQAMAAVAELAGLDQFVRVRGIPAEKAQACLADEAALDKLMQMNNAANQQYQVAGTPTFLINGEVVENSADWTTLEPALRKAIG